MPTRIKRRTVTKKGRATSRGRPTADFDFDKEVRAEVRRILGKQGLSDRSTYFSQIPKKRKKKRK